MKETGRGQGALGLATHPPTEQSEVEARVPVGQVDPGRMSPRRIPELH